MTKNTNTKTAEEKVMQWKMQTQALENKGAFV